MYKFIILLFITTLLYSQPESRRGDISTGYDIERMTIKPLQTESSLFTLTPKIFNYNGFEINDYTVEILLDNEVAELYVEYGNGKKMSSYGSMLGYSSLPMALLAGSAHMYDDNSSSATVLGVTSLTLLAGGITLNLLGNVKISKAVALYNATRRERYYSLNVGINENGLGVCINF